MTNETPHRASRLLKHLLDGGRIKIRHETFALAENLDKDLDLCVVAHDGKGQECFLRSHATLGAFIRLVEGLTDNEWTLAAASMALTAINANRRGARI